MLILLFCGYVYGAAFCTFMYDFIETRMVINVPGQVETVGIFPNLRRHTSYNRHTAMP